MDDRVRDERVRGPERSEEQRRRGAVAVAGGDGDAEDERQRERERAEGERTTAVRLELVEVELEPGEEHEHEDPEVAEGLDDAVALDPAEDERPDEQAAEDHSDDPRQADPLDEQRPEQDDGRRDEERPLGGRRRELEREWHGGESLARVEQNGRRRSSASCRVLCLVRGEQPLLLVVPREHEVDEHRAEEDRDDTGGVRPVVAVEECLLRPGDDRVGVLRMLLRRRLRRRRTTSSAAPASSR